MMVTIVDKEPSTSTTNRLNEHEPPKTKQIPTDAVVLPAQSDSSSSDDDDDDEEEQHGDSPLNRTKTMEEQVDGTESSAPSVPQDRRRGHANMPSLLDNDESKNDENESPITTTTFDIELSSSPTKKRRLSPSSSERSSTSVVVWDGFVRKGTRLKGFLDEALHLVTNSLVPSTETNDDTTTPPVVRPLSVNTPRRRQHDHVLADIAREKTVECMILQKKLKEAETHASAMTAANASLRESTAASNERLERTVEALRIAGTNAANARADADAAEACATTMATQLQALRDTVEETKRASQVVYQEQEQVTIAARSLEAKLLQKETELARSLKEQRQWMEERQDWKDASNMFQQDCKMRDQEISVLKQELHKMNHAREEYEAVEQARRDRSFLVEKELRDARNMLVEATAVSAEAESTASVLHETIQTLEQENKRLHESIETMQQKSAEESTRLNDALTKAEKEAQSLRVKAVSHEEDLQRIRMDRSASEKQVSSLKTKVATLERRIKDATSYTVPLSPNNNNNKDNNHVDQQQQQASRVSFSIPPLSTTNTPATAKKKSSTNAPPKSNCVTPGPKSSTGTKSMTCCLCGQLASGFMKSCQCGQPTCDKRAHTTCLANNKTKAPPPPLLLFSSVSHPGTPALRSPVLLCDANGVDSTGPTRM